MDRRSVVGSVPCVLGFLMSRAGSKTGSASTVSADPAGRGRASGKLPFPTGTSAGRIRGRPRSPQADAAIFRATLELLPEQGFRAFSMEAVAARARVSKATLYRRFPSKRELIAAALRAIRSTRPAPDTGSFRGDLRELVRREVARAKRVPHIGRLAARLLGDMADEPDMLALVQETVMAIDCAMLSEIVLRGIARGELRPNLDVSLASEILHASLVFRFLTSGGRLNPMASRDSSRLVNTLLAGFARELSRSTRGRKGVRSTR